MQNAAEANTSPTSSTPPAPSETPLPSSASQPVEIGGPPGLEPTRYGDWEKKGRCIDF